METLTLDLDATMRAHRDDAPAPAATGPAIGAAPVTTELEGGDTLRQNPVPWQDWVAYGLSFAGLATCPPHLEALTAGSPRSTTLTTHRPAPRWPDVTHRAPHAPDVTHRAPHALDVTHRAPHAPDPSRRGHRAPSPVPSHRAPRTRTLTMHSYREPRPGGRWRQLLEATWAAYRAWYLREGEGARPSLAECETALRTHLPALVPTWERLVAEAAKVDGVDRDLAARLLSGWCVPAYATGCSQVALTEGAPALVRNYDYDPHLFEGVVASTRYAARDVLGTSDLLWGLLDGVNGDGLAVSLTWGGRPGDGPGFAIPVVVRALLETCATVAEAVEALATIPVAQAYNLTLVDASGAHATVFVAPGEAPVVSALPVATNHRLTEVEFAGPAAAVASMPRQQRLLGVLADKGAATGDGKRSAIVGAMLEPPVRATAYTRGFGTLYTAEYLPGEGSVVYHWPGRSWRRGLTDPDEQITVELPDA